MEELGFKLLYYGFDGITVIITSNHKELAKNKSY